MYSAPSTQPHTRQTTPISPAPFPSRTVDSFPAQFSQLARDNRELEARARELAVQMKKFQGKLSEMRGLERDLAEREAEVKLFREENERMRRELAQTWVRGKGEGLESDTSRLRSALKAVQERLAGLAQAARLFLQQTAQIPMPERDSMWTQLMENLAFELEKSHFSPRIRSRGPSPGRSPFESTTFESKHSELSRNSPEPELPRLISEPGQGETMSNPPPQVHRLKGLVGELQRRNEALEATIALLEGRLQQEEQLKGEREALERDCEELKQENGQFISQLEWMAREQTALKQTLATYADTAEKALHDFYEGCVSAHQACLTPLLPCLHSALAQVTALTSQVNQAAQRPKTALAQLRNALYVETQRAESDRIEARNAVEAWRSRVAALEKAEAAGKGELRALKAKLVANEGEKKALLEGKEKEIADLQAKLKDFLRNKEERKSLKAEIAALRRQLDSERKQFEVQLQEFTQNTLKTSENARIRLETDIKSLQKEIKKLETLLKSAEMEEKAAKEELLQAKQTFQASEMRFKTQIMTENEGKSRIAAESVQKSTEIAKLKSELASFQIKYAKKLQNMRNIKEIGVEIEKLRKEVAVLVQSMGRKLVSASADWGNSVAGYVETQENVIIHLRSQLRQLEEENSALGSENSFLNQETEHLKTDLERERQSKAHHSTAIAEANSAMKAIHASWQVSSQEYQEVYELAVALQIQLRETELRREEYREQTCMIGEDWARWGERVVPLAVYRTQVKRLEKESERKERELDQVTESLFKLVRQQEELQELLAQKERGLNRAEEERFRLEQLLSSSRKMALEEMDNLNQELMQVKEQLSKKDFQLEKLTALRRSLESRNSDLQAKLVKMQNSSLDKSLKWPKGRLSEDYSGHVQTETSRSLKLRTGPRSQGSKSPESRSLSHILDSDLRSISLSDPGSSDSDLSNTLQEEVNQLNRLHPGEVLCKRVVHEGVTWLLVSAQGRGYHWVSDCAQGDSIQSLLADIDTKEKELQALGETVKRLEDVEVLFEPYMGQGEELVIAVSKLLQDYEQIKRVTSLLMSPEASIQSKNMLPLPIQSCETDYISSDWPRRPSDDKFPYSHLKNLIATLLHFLPILYFSRSSEEAEATIHKVCLVLAFSGSEIEAIHAARKLFRRS